jgi:Anthranilate/para-aminobenzoate synthases component I
MKQQEFVDVLNAWGEQRKPFLFITDFELENPLAFPLHEVDPSEILFDIQGFRNFEKGDASRATGASLQKHPVPFDVYEQKFLHVARHLSRGDSYLLNLTIKTGLSLDCTLLDIFHISAAPYKLWFKDQFTVFSPESFIKIRDGRIFSYPMKGTIDASLPDAEETIMKDAKELAEHVTIVDLIRNDLSLIARDVKVNRFRYVDLVKTSGKDLLQVSSEIVGTLNESWPSQLGAILMSLLPAGSISGAPKQRTLEIIREAENEKRGYYTGVFGYFDGRELNSGVMIRFIERDGPDYFYRSGGGITTQSNAKSEYDETLNKVYVPVD